MIESSKQIFIKSVGKKLKEKRLLKGFSQELLAHEADIPPNQISRIERGEINTTIGTLFKICKALGIEVSELVGF